MGSIRHVRQSHARGQTKGRLWLAIVVIAAIAIVGLFVMFGVMWHDDAPAPS
jgi:hypothetical protein